MTQTQTQEKKAKPTGFVLPDHDAMVNNIIDAYNRATPAQVGTDTQVTATR